MVVRTLVQRHTAYAEELGDVIKNSAALGALNNHELGEHLEADLGVLTEDGHAEGTFSVDETNDPSSFEQSFLLVVRTRHIVTVHLLADRDRRFGELVVRDTRVFQHIARYNSPVTRRAGSDCFLP